MDYLLKMVIFHGNILNKGISEKLSGFHLDHRGSEVATNHRVATRPGGQGIANALGGFNGDPQVTMDHHGFQCSNDPMTWIYLDDL